MSVNEAQIRARKDEVADLIGRHEVALAYLRQELVDLEVAIRVCERFHDRHDYSKILPAKAGAPEEVRKPSGIPTMADMITHVLEVSDFDEAGSMEPKEILAQIRKIWWPDAPKDSVGPIAWRMWKEGKLQKDGSRYFLAEKQAQRSAFEILFGEGGDNAEDQGGEVGAM